jgi:hypothetical protein
VALLPELPAELRGLLTDINGFILHDGALHVRGASTMPEWHSLRSAWLGPQSFSALYPEVLGSDIPFAQDQLGDQFLLRDGAVLRLSAETGEMHQLAESLTAFFKQVELSIEDFLNVGLNHKMQPGQLLHAYPPFCCQESGAGASLEPLPAAEVILFHADLARQIRDLPEGTLIRFKVVD